VIMKTIVMAVFATFLGLNLFATQNLEDKEVKTRDKLDGLATSLAETRRQVDAAVEEARAAKAASERSYERMDALLDAIERGAVVGRGPAVPGPVDERTDEPAGPATPTKEDRESEPTIIAGKKVYPRNPGWTVICDKNANDDPKRAIPEDQVDWDAVMQVQLSGEPKGLNWYNDDRTVTVVELARYCAESLGERKTTNPKEWNAHLAERIEQSPDKTEFIVYLRKGVRWHRPALPLDQYPWLRKSYDVTAADVVYTVEMIRHPDSTSGLKTYWEELVSCEAIDDYTVRFKWERPNFYVLATTVGVRPMPSHIYGRDPQGRPYDEEQVATAFNDHWSAKTICGNGPYRFVEYEKGVLFRFERDENYWGPRATCKEMVWSIVEDPEQRLSRFWNGQAYSLSLAAEQYRRIILGDEAKDKGKIYKYSKFDQRPPEDWKYTYFIWRRPVYGGFSWNMRRPVLEDVLVRRALTHALNRRAVVDKLFYGLGELIPVGQSVFSPYFPHDMDPLPFDLDKARSLLDRAGWKDSDDDGIRDKVIDGTPTDLEFEILISSASPLQRAIAAMYKDDLLKCGARMKQTPASSALWSQRNAEFDFDGLIIFWYASYDSNPKQLWASEYADQPGSNNYPGYQNPEADAIFEKLITTFDYPTRIELYQRWYEMQHRDQPYTWIWSVHSPILLDTDWRVPEPKLPPPYVDRRLVFKWKD